MFRRKLARFCQLLEAEIKDEYPGGIQLTSPDGPIFLQECIPAGGNTGFVDTRSNGGDSAQQLTYDYDVRADVESHRKLDVLNCRAWWTAFDNDNKFKEIHLSLSMLHEMLRQKPVDAVIGFSQGACLATMLTALCENNPDRMHALSQQGDPVYIDPPQSAFHFALLSCGFRGNAEWYDGFYTPQLTTPIMFTVADFDTVVAPSLQDDWITVGNRSQVMRHKGGHWFPVDKASLQKMANFSSLHCPKPPTPVYQIHRCLETSITQY